MVENSEQNTSKRNNRFKNQKIRIKQNLTITGLCKLTEIEEVLLYTYKSGLIDPSVREIARISIALNRRSYYMLGRIDKETNDIY